jgi:hypothetical protein
MHLIFLCICFWDPTGQDALSVQKLESDRHIEISMRLTSQLTQVLKQAKDPTDFEFASGILHIAVVGSKGQTGPPIFARYRVNKSRLILKPKYPLLAGVTYRITARDGEESVSREYKVASKTVTERPRVTSIYPSGSILPANCLKFYVHFSKPMREGRVIFEQIEIRDQEGQVVHDPWRRTELWSDDAKRLTLWIHPGRIKQGVNLRDDFGPVLKPKQKYRLVITQRVKDVEGASLSKAFEKEFSTIAEDRSRPKPSRWILNQPKIGSREPIVIQFGEPLDRALLSRMITVRRDSSRLPGSLLIGKHETSWSFKPQTAWRAEKHSIIVDGRLEDLAGNTPLRVFDTDLSAPKPNAPKLSIPIELSR